MYIKPEKKNEEKEIQIGMKLWCIFQIYYEIIMLIKP